MPNANLDEIFTTKEHCSCCQENISVRAPSCPKCGALTEWVWAGQLLDVIFGALLSFLVYSYAKIILEMVYRFSALKAEPWEQMLSRWSHPLPMKLALMSVMTLYIIIDIGDVKKRLVWFPQSRDPQYLYQVLIASLFALSLELVVRAHYGAAFPFAFAMFLGGYGSYLTACGIKNEIAKSFFSAEGEVQAFGAAVGLLTWSLYAWNRATDALIPQYTLGVILWLLVVLIVGQSYPRRGDTANLANRCQMNVAFPIGIVKWLILQIKSPLQLDKKG